MYDEVSYIVRRYVLVGFIFDDSCHPYIYIHFEEMIFATCFLNFCICTSVVPRLIELFVFSVKLGFSALMK